MSKRIKALVEPSLLIWARKTSGLSETDAAKRIGVETETLKQWEDNQDKPTLAQLRKVSQVYRRHFSLFYLPKPPKDFDPLKDFRKLHGKEEEIASPALLFEMRLAQERHQIFKELMIDLGEEKFSLEYVFTAHGNPEDVADNLRARLRITPQEQMQWRQSSEAYNYWRVALERLGVSVSQTGAIPLEEMRGFSISDDYCPAIVVNSKDYPNGRLFTLLHEFTHVGLHNGGICLPLMLPKDRDDDLSLEKFCNHVAGAILLPSGILLNHEIVKSRDHQKSHWDDEELKELSNTFKVSQEVLLRRLLLLGRTTEAFYRKKRDEIIKHYAELPPRHLPMVKYHNKIVSNLGVPYISTVLRAHNQDIISSSELSSYLGVKLNHLPKIETAMTERMVRWSVAR
jgi:Zn-dependent peptidase ImmA (M78 family)/DNA-binding XRE family transcriptional regulator